MRFFLFALLMTSFTAQAASPFMSVKDRLRLHLWSFGLEEQQKIQVKKKVEVKPPVLPEEIERALRKI